MRFSATRMLLFCLAGTLAGWLTGRLLQPNREAAAMAGKRVSAIRGEVSNPKEPDKKPQVKFEEPLPDDLTQLVAEQEGVWTASGIQMASRLRQLERCDSAQLAAIARRLLSHNNASPASTNMAAMALLLLAERDADLAVDVACAAATDPFKASFVALLAGELCRRNGGDEGALRRWVGGKDKAFTEALIIHLAKVDPEKAMELWSAVKPVSTGGGRTWGDTSDLVAALALAGRIDLSLKVVDSATSPDLKRVSLHIACTGVTEAQIPELQSRLEVASLDNHVWTTFAKRFGDLNPQAAKAWAQTLTDSGKMTAVYKGLGSAFAVGHLELIKEWLSSLPEGQTRTALLSGVLPELHPWDTKALLAAEKSLPAEIVNLEAVASDIYRSDPAAALKWVATLPESPGKERIMEYFRQERSRSDPLAFLKELSVQSGSGPDQELVQTACENVARHWPLDWLAWCGTLPPAESLERLNEYWRTLESHAPAVAARFAAERADFQAKVGPAAKEWAFIDIDAAASWASSLVPGTVRDAAISGVSDAWRRQNPADCEAWLRGLGGTK